MRSPRCTHQVLVPIPQRAVIPYMGIILTLGEWTQAPVAFMPPQPGPKSRDLDLLDVMNTRDPGDPQIHGYRYRGDLDVHDVQDHQIPRPRGGRYRHISGCRCLDLHQMMMVIMVLGILMSRSSIPDPEIQSHEMIQILSGPDPGD